MARAKVVVSFAILLVASTSCNRSNSPHKAPKADKGQTVAQAQAQPEEDAHRPACLTASCEKIKAFLKKHYCGESPFGNGPDDGCDARVEKKRVHSTKVAVDYICNWNDTDGTSKCEQRGVPSPEDRSVLVREMRRAGLPAQGEKEIHFKVLKSTLGWSLMAANYDHTSGIDLMTCQVVVVVSRNRQVHVLRKVSLHKENVDVPEGTTWSPVDIADVDGDGHTEVILQGNAYEDHWFEVVRVHDNSFKTLFSGLGYYL